MDEDERIKEINAMTVKLAEVLKKGKKLGVIRDVQETTLTNCIKLSQELIMRLRKQKVSKLVRKLAEEKRFPKD